MSSCNTISLRPLLKLGALSTLSFFCFLFLRAKFKSRILQQWFPAKRKRTPQLSSLDSLTVMLISSEDDFDSGLFTDLCSEHRVVGVDCEWVASEGRAPLDLALLQVCFPDGHVFLFRLFMLPRSVVDVVHTHCLRQANIFKFGVGIQGDASKLLTLHGVEMWSWVDLRCLLDKFSFRPQKTGLSSLAWQFLGVSLKKGKISSSNWKAPTLSFEQITYAALDASVSLDILFAILQAENDEVLTDQQLFHQHLDVIHKASMQSADSKKLLDKVHANRNSANNIVLKQDGSIKGLCSSSKSEIYSNCRLEAPDGKLLCTCSRKKTQWYIDKDLGERIDPLTVRLKFEPKSRPGEEDIYYVEPKENRCVVCGSGPPFIRKNVVPVEYRKHFPRELKDHMSHDTVVLCALCHRQSNVLDLALRQQLVHMCHAPLGGNETARIRAEDPRRLRARRSASTILKHRSTLPQQRLDELMGHVAQFHQVSVDEVTDALLQQTADLVSIVAATSERMQPHGLKVCQYFVQSGQGLDELKRQWRQHFLDCMNPQYLPNHWSVHHRPHYKGKIYSDDEIKTYLFNGGKWQQGTEQQSLLAL